MDRNHILLLAAPGDAREAIGAALRASGVSVEACESAREADRLLAGVPFHALLFEASTLVRAGAEGRAWARQLGSLYPAARVRFDPRNGALRLRGCGPLEGVDETLDEFLGALDTTFAGCAPRRLRAAPRVASVLPLLLCPGPRFALAEARRCVTVDLAEHGCFVCDVEPWRVGEQAALLVPGLDDPQPITASVRWHAPWGTTGRLPGIGVRFGTLGVRQREALRALLAPAF